MLKQSSGKIIGLTGGIASGKSTVAQILRREGAYHIDLDRTGHEVYEPGKPAFQEIITAFGHDIVNSAGEIDRKRLGALVFSDTKARERLNHIVWPKIIADAKMAIAALRKDHPESTIVVEGAVLIEANCIDLFDEVWVVYTSDEVAIARLKERNGLSTEAARQRLSAQINNATRLKHADKSIENNGSLRELEIKTLKTLK